MVKKENFETDSDNLDGQELPLTLSYNRPLLRHPADPAISAIRPDLQVATRDQLVQRVGFEVDARLFSP